MVVRDWGEAKALRRNIVVETCCSAGLADVMGAIPGSSCRIIEPRDVKEYFVQAEACATVCRHFKVAAAREVNLCCDTHFRFVGALSTRGLTFDGCQIITRAMA